MIDLHQISAEPLLVAPHGAAAFAHSLRAEVPAKREPFDHALDVAAVFGAQAVGREDKAFAFDPKAGVAFIPVRGALVNRFGGAYSDLTGYQAIVRMAEAAGADPEVRGVVQDVDTYGGEAAGAFEAARQVRAALAGKPSLAIVNSAAYSAGYALAVAADKIAVIPSGGVGSIGVVRMHLDQSGMLDRMGLKVSFVHAGAHKVDGNPYAALPDDVRADMQARVDQFYDAFVDHVVSMRPGLTAEAIRATEARTYSATDALAVGLIDAVSNAPDAYAAFVASLPAAAGAQSQEAPVPDIDKAAVAGAERARIKAIITGAEAEGRGELANKLAFDTDMAADMAVGILAAAPRAAKAPAAAAPAADPLAAAMAVAGTPGILPAEAAGATDDLVAQILAFQK